MLGLLIRPVRENEPLPYALLLSADPSEEAIQAYLPQSKVYVAEIDQRIIAVYVLYQVSESEAEIKNIAVDEAFQRQGIGKLLLADATLQATKQGYAKLLIGTSNASTGQLYLYQQQGFEIYGIKHNFFISNYTEPIFENGIQCKHMIMLGKKLK